MQKSLHCITSTYFEFHIPIGIAKLRKILTQKISAYVMAKFFATLLQQLRGVAGCWLHPEAGHGQFLSQ